jgi:hypothetical protein
VGLMMRKTKNNRGAQKTFTNYEIVALAAYLAGAKASYTDTEDIAVKANVVSMLICSLYFLQVNRPGALANLCIAWLATALMATAPSGTFRHYSAFTV